MGASSSELELTTSGTTWPRTIAPQLKRTSRTSVLRSSPDTTSGCWTPLSTTTSWTEPCTCARLWASVTHSGAAGTLVRSASRALNGWRTTSRTDHDRRVRRLPRAELLPRRLGRLQGARHPGLPCHAQHGHGEVLHPHRDLQPAGGLRGSSPDKAPTVESRLFYGRKFI